MTLHTAPPPPRRGSSVPSKQAETAVSTAQETPETTNETPNETVLAYENLSGKTPPLPQPVIAPRIPDGTNLRTRETTLGPTPVGEVRHTKYEGHNGQVTLAVDKETIKVNGKAKKPRGKNLTTKVGPGVRTQQRDVFWLELAARFKWLSYEEMAAYASCSNESVRQRTYRLIPANYFDGWQVEGTTSLVTPTNRSAANYDVAYLKPGAGWAPKDLLLRHTSSVTRIGMHLWYRDPKHEKYYTLTEREIRAMLRGDGAYLFTRDASWAKDLDLSGEQFIIPEAGGFNYSKRGKSDSEYISSGYRMPDLVLSRKEGLPIAIEVELTAKQRRDYVELFNDYLSNAARERFAGVQYYVGSRELKSTLEKAAAEVGADGFIRVEQFPANMPLPITQITRVTGMRLGEVSDE